MMRKVSLGRRISSISTAVGFFLASSYATSASSLVNFDLPSPDNPTDGLRFGYDDSTRTAFVNGGINTTDAADGATFSIRAQSSSGHERRGGSISEFAGSGLNGANGGTMTVEGGIAVGGGRGGDMRIASGDSLDGPAGHLEVVGGNSGTGRGGDVFLSAGSGGNVALGQGGTGWALSDWRGMVGGYFIHDATSAPYSPAEGPDPQVGLFLYIVNGVPYIRSYSSHPYELLSFDSSGKVTRWGLITNDNIAPNASIAPSKLGAGGATPGQALVYDGSSWTPGTTFSTVTVGEKGDTTGTNLSVNGATTTARPTCGAAAPLPFAPAGYLLVNVNGTERRIPYY